MFFSYFASVILLSFALYGIWRVVRDVWAAFLAPRLEDPLRASLLIIVRNSERQIEGMIRYLLQQTAGDSFWHEFVIVDFASDDITPAILDRLAGSYPQIRVVHLSELSRPIVEGIALCQGEVVYVLDFVNRMRVEHFIPAIGVVKQL